MRSEGFEPIQYQPTTPEVRQTPLLIVPPMINKFYITDLAPGKSLVEYLVAQGQQVFSISWRNPDREHRDWDLDHYAAAVLSALDAVESITASERTHVVGNCAGGLLAASLCGHLAAAGGLDRIASLTLGVCVIDNERSNVVDAMATPRSIRAATAASARKGYLDGAELASMFLWLRPNDSCGRTSSTTGCSARSRQRSTSSTGTRTRRGSRPRCTATSWRSPAKTSCATAAA
jgi:poly(3-hydroxyalkanoate) synthetase